MRKLLGMLAAMVSFLGAAANPAAGQVLHVVRDLNTMFGPASSSPTKFMASQGRVFFSATPAGHGESLVVTDGTYGTGTRILYDFGPSGGSIEPVTPFGAGLIFVATYGSRQLWYSDGTPSGTLPLTSDLNSLGQTLTAWAVAGQRFFFSGSSVSSGAELWVSDATPQGTSLIDIAPGASSSSPSAFAELNGRVYFAATTSAVGRELWVSDGTVTGTGLFADIYQSAGNSAPLGLVRVGNRLWFSAISYPYGREPWMTDGTLAGTARVADVFAGSSNSNPTGFAAFQTRVLFSATRSATGIEPFISDGTSMGTVLLRDINPGSASSNPQFFTSAGTRALFIAGSPATIWVTDGTAVGTLDTGWVPMGTGGTNPFVTSDGVVYVLATSSQGESGLLKVDGQSLSLVVPGLIIPDAVAPQNSIGFLPGGVVGFARSSFGFAEPVAADLGSGSFAYLRMQGQETDPAPSGYCVADGYAVLAITTATSGREPWVTRGTPQTTGVLKELGDSQGALNANPRALTPFASSLGFIAEVDDAGTAVLATDGYASTTIVLKKSATQTGDVLFAIDDLLGFIDAGSDGQRQAIWGSDAVEGGARLIFEAPDIKTYSPMYSATAGQLIRYRRTNQQSGLAVLRPGSYLLDSLIEVSAGVDFRTKNFRESYGGVYFGCRTSSTDGIELWLFDGQTARILRRTVAQGNGADPSDMTPMAGFTYYAGTQPQGDRELWRSDGTTEGTIPFADLNPATSSAPHALAKASRGIVFVAKNPAANADKFHVLEQSGLIIPVSGPYLPLATTDGDLKPVVLDGVYYAIAGNAQGRPVVWRSDGTAAGTLEFFGSALPDWRAVSLSAAAGHLFIRASDLDHGTELWISDGTAQGTFLAPEPTPGPDSSNPGPVVGVGHRAFFAADSPDTGRELFMLDMCPGDFNNDGAVDATDLQQWLAAFQLGDDHADTDGSGFVDVDDFASFVSYFEGTCP